MWKDKENKENYMIQNNRLRINDVRSLFFVFFIITIIMVICNKVQLKSEKSQEISRQNNEWDTYNNVKTSLRCKLFEESTNGWKFRRK